jgi:hypothetical protein
VVSIADHTTWYADALAANEKNLTDCKVKPTVDKAFRCQAKSWRVFEFPKGPSDRRILINRITFPAVKKCETAFCGSS